MKANKLSRLKQAAGKLHTHTVVFKTGSDEDIAVRLALCGQSTQAIMEETGLSESQVIYRLHKASVTRAAYRNGTGDFARRVLPVITKLAAVVVKENIAPKFAPYAAARLNQ
jgi:hypothetical protein